MDEFQNIDGVLKEIFESSEAEGYAGESFDNTVLSKPQRHEVTQKAILNTLVGTSCFSCGEVFDAPEAMKSYYVGPIQEEGGAAYVHKKCFHTTFKNHPELKSSIGKPSRDYTAEEITQWRNAFSVTNKGTLFGKLFADKK